MNRYARGYDRGSWPARSATRNRPTGLPRRPRRSRLQRRASNPAIPAVLDVTETMLRQTVPCQETRHAEHGGAEDPRSSSRLSSSDNTSPSAARSRARNLGAASSIRSVQFRRRRPAAFVASLRHDTRCVLAKDRFESFLAVMTSEGTIDILQSGPSNSPGTALLLRSRQKTLRCKRLCRT